MKLLQLTSNQTKNKGDVWSNIEGSRLLAVDLNAKNEAWGRKVTDARALKLMDIPKIYEWQLVNKDSQKGQEIIEELATSNSWVT